MNRAPALACLLVVAAPAWAQHEGHDMSQMQDMPGMSAEEHARMMQATEPPIAAPGLAPLTAEQRAHAFPDLGDMDMRGHMDDDPFIATLAFDRLETYRGNDANVFAWELHGWAGRREDRFGWRSRGEHSGGQLHGGELELLWSHATGPWWNRTLGIRHDFGSGENHDWLALGVEGTAPYKIDVNAALYAGSAGVGARVEASYDLLLSQRWVLQPRLEASAYAGRDAPNDAFEAGLRLRYDISRQFSPYLGYAWSTDSDDSRGHWLAGVRTWF